MIFIFLALIRIYQKILSPDTGVLKFAISPIFPAKACRYNPSCSQYFYEALKIYGIIQGVRLGVKRILRCHPWSSHGSDPLARV